MEMTLTKIKPYYVGVVSDSSAEIYLILMQPGTELHIIEPSPARNNLPDYWAGFLRQHQDEVNEILNSYNRCLGWTYNGQPYIACKGG